MKMYFFIISLYYLSLFLCFYYSPSSLFVIYYPCFTSSTFLLYFQFFILFFFCLTEQNSNYFINEENGWTVVNFIMDKYIWKYFILCFYEFMKLRFNAVIDQMPAPTFLETQTGRHPVLWTRLCHFPQQIHM